MPELHILAQSLPVEQRAGREIRVLLRKLPPIVEVVQVQLEVSRRIRAFELPQCSSICLKLTLPGFEIPVTLGRIGR
jgi:hypothetical protein